MHKRLGDAELEIIQIIWAQQAPMTSSAILKELRQRQWKLSTLITTLERLVDKGFLRCDRTTRINIAHKFRKIITERGRAGCFWKSCTIIRCAAF